MLGGLSFALRLRRLQKSKRRIRKAYNKEHNQMKQQGKGRDDLSELDYHEQSEIDYVDEKIARLQMQYLISASGKILSAET